MQARIRWSRSDKSISWRRGDSKPSTAPAGRTWTQPEIPIEILKSRKDLEANFGTGPDHLGWASFEEERREVLESVLEALAEPGVDADRLAACAGLLRGLMGARLCRRAAQGRCSNASRSRESRGATPVRPPNRMALYAAVNSPTAAPTGPGGSELANSAGVNQAGF